MPHFELDSSDAVTYAHRLLVYDWYRLVFIVCSSGAICWIPTRSQLGCGWCDCFVPFVAEFAHARPCYSGLRASLCCPAWQLVVVAVCQLLNKDYYCYYYYYYCAVDTKFKQQQLPAWQPILTARTVLPLLFAIGVGFIPLGVAFLITANSVCIFEMSTVTTACRLKPWLHVMWNLFKTISAFVDVRLK